MQSRVKNHALLQTIFNLFYTNMAKKPHSGATHTAVPIELIKGSTPRPYPRVYAILFDLY